MLYVAIDVTLKIDRRTNYYALTQRGQREIDARAEWEAQYLEQPKETVEA